MYTDIFSPKRCGKNTGSVPLDITLDVCCKLNPIIFPLRHWQGINERLHWDWAAQNVQIATALFARSIDLFVTCVNLNDL